jgi:Protein of unknown function (DUF3108)
MIALGAGRRSVSRFAYVGVALLGGLSLASQPVSAQQSRKVTAEYSINFNGLSIGTFKLWSDLDSAEYKLKARANISLLAGILFEWQGDTSSSGRVMARLPRPYAYSFGYATSDKRETVDVKFSNNIVEEIAVNPPQRQSASRIPVTRKHMRNVVDPLSAIVMLTNVGSNKSGEEVCSRRLPIFDGKSRYDLKLTYKTTKRVSADGYQGPAYVCKVKFLPIAGHKAGDKENSFAAKSESMEVWMIPLAKAELYVPYYIYLPTPAGSATLTSAGFNVETGGQARRALAQ